MSSIEQTGNHLALMIPLMDKLRPPMDMGHSAHDNSVPVLPQSPRAPLAHPGAIPDEYRAKKPPLVQPPASDEQLNPGDRVEGLGNFGKPLEEYGTVEQVNENDAVVKWDDDGRMRLAQPWLKKV